MLFLLLVSGCSLNPQPLSELLSRSGFFQASPEGRVVLLPLDTRVQQVTFYSSDGTRLAGQIDWPPNKTGDVPLVFIIHHSGAVDRDSYQYLAAHLVPAGYATFRFDKRGTGSSRGTYGCCEAEDALAAYAAAVEQGRFESGRVYIAAQSIGTQILAEHFAEFEAVHQPAGVLLLSSLLAGEEVLAIRAPVHIVLSDSEPELAALGEKALAAHRAAYDYGASLYIAEHSEHTLFDTSQGPIDWGDPTWPERFHDGARLSILAWLAEREQLAGAAPPWQHSSFIASQRSINSEKNQDRH